jgi:hypothetical protein
MIKKLKKIWLKFAHILGIINTTILLSILYFLIIGIYAVIRNIINLPKKLIFKEAKTYWIKRNLNENLDIENFKHPF